MAEKQLIMTFLHLLFLTFLTECFSLPKVFLAGTASLGQDRRFVMAFCETRKKSQKTFIKKQGGDVFLSPRHHPVLLGSGARKQRSPCMVVGLIQSPAGLEEPLLRTPSVPVSQSHKHPPPAGMTPAHPWLPDLIFVAPRLSCYNSPPGVQSHRLQTLQLIQSTIPSLLSNTRFHEHLTP